MSRDHSVVEMRGLLVVVASLVAEPELQALGFSSCGLWGLECWLSSGARAYLSCGVWDPSGPGIESVSPALAGGLLATGSPENSQQRL